MIAGDDAPLAEALRRYHAENGFRGDSLTAETVQLDLLGRALDLPNPRFQRHLLARHDLHHVLTGYGTDLRGEAELGAWELASGARRMLHALVEVDVQEPHELAPLSPRARRFACAVYVWINNVAALALGVLAPLRTAKAFVRGLRARSLYHDDTPYAQLLATPVGVLRARLRIR